MSLNAHFRPISAALHERLRTEPALVWRITGKADRAVPASFADKLPAAYRAQLAAHLRRVQAAPEVNPADLGTLVGVGKAWDALHYLVTGRRTVAPGIAQFILGGVELGEDLWSGPARVLSPADVAAIVPELPDVEMVAERYRPKDLDELGISPRIWLRDGADAWLWLAQAYAPLLAMYHEAAARGDAVVLWID